MKKRYARAKPIKKKKIDEEPTIIELDTFRLSVLIGTILTSILILIPIFIGTIIPWFFETFL